MDIYRVGGRLYEACILGLTLGREERLKARSIGSLGIQPGDRVLDWGCGTGLALCHIVPPLQGRGTIYAVDSSPNMVRRAVARFESSPELTFHFVIREGHELNLGADVEVAVASYSLGVAGFSDYGPPLEEIHRVLRDGGRFLIIDQYLPSPRNSWDRWRIRIVRHISERYFKQDFSSRLLVSAQRFFRTAHLEFHPNLLTFVWVGEKVTNK